MTIDSLCLMNWPDWQWSLAADLYCCAIAAESHLVNCEVARRNRNSGRPQMSNRNPIIEVSRCRCQQHIDSVTAISSVLLLSDLLQLLSIDALTGNDSRGGIRVVQQKLSPAYLLVEKGNADYRADLNNISRKIQIQRPTIITPAGAQNMTSVE